MSLCVQAQHGPCVTIVAASTHNRGSTTAPFQPCGAATPPTPARLPPAPLKASIAHSARQHHLAGGNNKSWHPRSRNGVSDPTWHRRRHCWAQVPQLLSPTPITPAEH